MAGVTSPRPLREDDDRRSFDCGRSSMNAWFRRHAWRNHRDGISRVNVVCDAGTDAMIGYVTLSTGSIEREYLPKSDRRNRPETIGVTLLGQLAVDTAHQGKGHARSLLLFALKTALAASREIGSLGVIAHPIDDDVRDFYRGFGFVDLPHDPKGAMIVRMADLEKSGF